ncbi:His-Xaa-Ser system protein HxsD [Flavobacterium sp. ST-87]|uniref:His-Xaa-Ser system protein HxsD n=1 Tax=Flavobacterium plantiphilum TaxID=3163297 RepID=A0ABW8XPA9_9FLAO
MNDIQRLVDKLCFTLEDVLYEENVLYKCFYWYGGDYDVSITKEKDRYYIQLLSKSEMNIDHDALEIKIRQDLIDFKLRDIVAKETKNIRELLTAKAFAHFQNEENPVSEVSDPVGFNPNEF